MNSTVQQSIATQLLTLVPIQKPAQPPLGYGVDLDCVLDCTPYMTEVNPLTARALGQALLRRVLTPRSSVIDDKDFGIDLRSYLNRGSTTRDLQSLAGRVRGQWLKDDRVQECTATATVSTDGKTLTITGSITPVSPYGRTFDLVFSVVDSEVLIKTLA